MVSSRTKGSKEFAHLSLGFSLLWMILDLGMTSVVKHTMKLTNPTPFNKRHRQILPDQFEEMMKHLQEMLEIGAIRKSCSPLAIAVVLV